MLSQPTTKFILRTAEPNAAKWAAEMIGEVEIERVRETVADGKRQGKSFTLDRQIEPLVMKSEVEGLPDLHAFVKINNYVSRFSFPHMSFPKIANALESRAIPEHKMWFNPLSPEPGAESEHLRVAQEDRDAAEGGNEERRPARGAPAKQADASVPKPVLLGPTGVTANKQPPALTHNL